VWKSGDDVPRGFTRSWRLVCLVLMATGTAAMFFAYLGLGHDEPER
jgi:hypothetical protein